MKSLLYFNSLLKDNCNFFQYIVLKQITVIHYSNNFITFAFNFNFGIIAMTQNKGKLRTEEFKRHLSEIKKGRPTWIKKGPKEPDEGD